MRLVDDPEAGRWLEELEGCREDFDWDDGNMEKNRKHGVEAKDIEAMFGRTMVLGGRIVEPASNEPRWIVLGEDDARRKLALIFTRRGQRVRAISCRSMRRNERRFYEDAIGSIEEDGEKGA